MERVPGQCSIQAWLTLNDGKNLRVGITDDDVTESPGIWVDVHQDFFNDIDFDDGRRSICACCGRRGNPAADYCIVCDDDDATDSPGKKDVITLRFTIKELDYIQAALDFQLDHDDDEYPPYKKHGESAALKVLKALQQVQT